MPFSSPRHPGDSLLQARRLHSSSAVLGGRNQSLETRIDPAGWQREERKGEQPVEGECIWHGSPGWDVLSLEPVGRHCVSPPAPGGGEAACEPRNGEDDECVRASALSLTTPVPKQLVQEQASDPGLMLVRTDSAGCTGQLPLSPADGVCEETLTHGNMFRAVSEP